MSVRIKIDEDLPTEVAERLRAAGHDACTVREQERVGATDRELWDLVQSEERMLVTADKGFADPRTVGSEPHHGIVLLRLPRESRSGYIRLIEALLDVNGIETAGGAIVVVTPSVIRVLRHR